MDKMLANTKLWKDGEITYNEWARSDVNLWLGEKIDELNKALLPPKLIKGAKEGVHLLQSNGFKVILVSGGIHILVDHVKDLVNADEAYSVIIGHNDGLIDGSLDIQVGNSKADTLNMIAKRPWKVYCLFHTILLSVKNRRKLLKLQTVR